MNDKLKALEAALGAVLAYAKHEDSCGDRDAYNNEAMQTCGCGLDSAKEAAYAELDALAATLTPLGDKDREAVEAMDRAIDCMGAMTDADTTALIRKNARAYMAHIATRLAESGGGEAIGHVTPYRSVTFYNDPPGPAPGTKLYTTPPAAAVERSGHVVRHITEDGSRSEIVWADGVTPPSKGRHVYLAPPTPSAGVSEAMVDAAAEELWWRMAGHNPHYYRHLWPKNISDADAYRDHARAALAAAEGVK